LKFQKIRGDISLHNSTSRILQTIAGNAHYTVVLTLRYSVKRQL